MKTRLLLLNMIQHPTSNTGDEAWIYEYDREFRYQANILNVTIEPRLNKTRSFWSKKSDAINNKALLKANNSWSYYEYRIPHLI